MRAPRVLMASSPLHPTLMDLGQVQFLLSQQQASAPSPPAGLFLQTNHILLWDPGGTTASGYDKA